MEEDRQWEVQAEMVGETKGVSEFDGKIPIAQKPIAHQIPQNSQREIVAAAEKLLLNCCC